MLCRLAQQFIIASSGGIVKGCRRDLTRFFARSRASCHNKTPAGVRQGLVAERKGFEPLRALGALHDFQSCALDQLSHLSKAAVRLQESL